ncbi:MAG: LutB/LldF family L-lactate oxidation iron-sulfur protein [Desulfomonilaceae bacterium]
MNAHRRLENLSPFSFRRAAAACVRDPVLRQAVRKATDLLGLKRGEALERIPWEAWREKASAVRSYAVDHMTELVDAFAVNATRAGAVVYRAENGEDACSAVYHILKDRKASHVVKAKSMVTEEIGLNHYLEDRGIKVVETDLGEFIIQLAGEKPSHILGPAIHKTRSQVGRLFEEKLGVAFCDDPERLTRIAREKLREVFLSAHAGITGANFAIADTGSLMLFTNEGNGRMVTTLPPLHVAVFSVEKILPSISDAPLLANLLPRSATGQPLSSYLSVITGTRKTGDATGPRELHIVLLDNGRSRIADGDFKDILKCIRCSACLNVCPVYATVGGHAYGSVYSGPMGIILTVLLKGMQQFHSILDACTLCGACSEACPVKVPLKEMISGLRQIRVEDGFTPLTESVSMKGMGLTIGSSTRYRAARKVLPHLWPVLTSMLKENRLDRLPTPRRSEL